MIEHQKGSRIDKHVTLQRAILKSSDDIDIVYMHMIRSR